MCGGFFIFGPQNGFSIMTKLNEVPGEVYGFWARIGDWIGRHPRTTAAIIFALAFIALVLAVN